MPLKQRTGVVGIGGWAVLVSVLKSERPHKAEILHVSYSELSAVDRHVSIYETLSYTWPINESIRGFVQSRIEVSLPREEVDQNRVLFASLRWSGIVLRR